jgi:Zn-dependent membrane protease YugP
MKVKICKMPKLIIFQIALYSTAFILNLIYITIKYDASLTANAITSGLMMLNLGIVLCKYSLS